MSFPQEVLKAWVKQYLTEQLVESTTQLIEDQLVVNQKIDPSFSKEVSYQKLVDVFDQMILDIPQPFLVDSATLDAEDVKSRRKNLKRLKKRLKHGDINANQAEASGSVSHSSKLLTMLDQFKEYVIKNTQHEPSLFPDSTQTLKETTRAREKSSSVLRTDSADLSSSNPPECLVAVNSAGAPGKKKKKHSHESQSNCRSDKNSQDKATASNADEAHGADNNVRNFNPSSASPSIPEDLKEVLFKLFNFMNSPSDNSKKVAEEAFHRVLGYSSVDVNNATSVTSQKQIVDDLGIVTAGSSGEKKKKKKRKHPECSPLSPIQRDEGEPHDHEKDHSTAVKKKATEKKKKSKRRRNRSPVQEAARSSANSDDQHAGHSSQSADIAPSCAPSSKTPSHDADSDPSSQPVIKSEPTLSEEAVDVAISNIADRISRSISDQTRPSNVNECRDAESADSDCQTTSGSNRGNSAVGQTPQSFISVDLSSDDSEDDDDVVFIKETVCCSKVPNSSPNDVKIEKKEVVDDGNPKESGSETADIPTNVNVPPSDCVTNPGTSATSQRSCDADNSRGESASDSRLAEEQLLHPQKSLLRHTNMDGRTEPAESNLTVPSERSLSSINATRSSREKPGLLASSSMTSTRKNTTQAVMPRSSKERKVLTKKERSFAKKIAHHECDACKITRNSKGNSKIHPAPNCCKHCRKKCASCSNAFVTSEMKKQKNVVRKTLTVKELAESHNVNVFKCSECNASYKSKKSLRRHILTKHHLKSQRAKKFKCANCDATYKDKKNLKYHILSVHLGERPSKCDQCDASFASATSLNYHMASKHSDERPYKCDECDLSFKLKFILNKHRRRHTTLKSFKCDKCDSSFVFKYELNGHKIRHSNLRPFKCPNCRKSFKTRSDLIKHELSHSSIKPLVVNYARAHSSL